MSRTWRNAFGLLQRTPLDGVVLDLKGLVLEQSRGTLWGVHLLLSVRGRKERTGTWNFGLLSGRGHTRYYCRVSWSSPAWWRNEAWHGRSARRIPPLGTFEFRSGSFFEPAVHARK